MLRIFRTEDGAQVFDESGKEVLRDELEFDLISPDSPTWEQRLELLGKQDSLTVERGQILKFQERLDHARERVDEGKITKDELDDLGSELADATPASVKRYMSGFDTADNAPAAKTAFAIKANPVTSTHPTNPQNAPHTQL